MLQRQVMCILDGQTVAFRYIILLNYNILYVSHCKTYCELTIYIISWPDFEVIYCALTVVY